MKIPTPYFSNLVFGRRGNGLEDVLHDEGEGSKAPDDLVLRYKVYFLPSLMARQNKLECLSRKRFSRLVKYL